jgi:hypothetical protein
MKKLEQLYAIFFRWVSVIPVVGRLFPRHPYHFIWASWAFLANCYVLIFKMGFFRATLTGNSVNRRGDPIPWLTYPAIAFLDGLNLSNKSVFEFGSGYSTAYFNRRAKSVVTVEHNPEWRDRIIELTGGKADIVLATDRTDFLNALDRRYDIIVIDAEYRLECAKISVEMVCPGDMIIMDNTDELLWADASQYMNTTGLLRVDFWGFIPRMIGSHCTSVFFKAARP